MLSNDAQVLLLVCSRLGLPTGAGPEALTLRDWNPLARKIQASKWETPGALLGRSAAEIAEVLEVPPAEGERIAALLERAGQVAMELERLESLGIWVMTRADDAYPARYKERLGDAAPLVLFGAGSRTVAGLPGLAIVGSRDVSETGQAAAQFLGNACATCDWVVYSGGARGVDGLAMGAALENGGRVVGLLADSLERTIRSADLRAALEAGTLTLLTPFSPQAPFSVGAAMGRNRLIYALADDAAVVASDAGSGGTWSGAIEALKHDWVPVFACTGADFPPGNPQLVKKGALELPYPFPFRPGELRGWIQDRAPQKLRQGELFE